MNQPPEPVGYGQPGYGPPPGHPAPVPPPGYGQPPPPGYGPPPGYSPQPPRGYGPLAPGPRPNPVLGIVSLCCGIAGLAIFGWMATMVSFGAPWMGILGLLLEITAIITGHVGLSQATRGRAGGRGLALAGLIIGYVLIALAVVAVGVVLLGVAAGWWD